MNIRRWDTTEKSYCDYLILSAYQLYEYKLQGKPFQEEMEIWVYFLKGVHFLGSPIQILFIEGTKLGFTQN